MSGSTARRNPPSPKEADFFSFHPTQVATISARKTWCVRGSRQSRRRNPLPLRHWCLTKLTGTAESYYIYILSQAGGVSGWDFFYRTAESIPHQFVSILSAVLLVLLCFIRTSLESLARARGEEESFWAYVPPLCSFFSPSIGTITHHTTPRSVFPTEILEPSHLVSLLIIHSLSPPLSPPLSLYFSTLPPPFHQSHWNQKIIEHVHSPCPVFLHRHASKCLIDRCVRYIHPDCVPTCTVGCGFLLGLRRKVGEGRLDVGMRADELGGLLGWERDRLGGWGRGRGSQGKEKGGKGKGPSQSSHLSLSLSSGQHFRSPISIPVLISMEPLPS